MSKKHHTEETPPAAPAEAVPAPAAAEPSVPTTAPEIDALKAQAEEWKDKCLRVAADLDNYRKRVTREKVEHTKYAAQHLLMRLLPIIDNFELALQHAEPPDATNASAARQFIDGLKMTLSQMHALLRDSGVEIVNAEGQTFDPQLHEAVSHLESDQHAAGAVMQQLRKGYRLHERLLRPATVVVSKGKPQPAAESAESHS